MTATPSGNPAQPRSVVPANNSKASRAWYAIRQLLELELPAEKFMAHVAKIGVVTDNKSDSSLHLLAPNEAAVTWLRNNLLGHIEHLASKCKVAKVTISARREPGLLVPAGRPANGRPAATASGLAPQFSFETFVGGSCNSVAKAAALKLATDPQASRTLSPLYIHGAVGLGKTHLAHAIGNRFQILHPQARLRVLSGEQFMREVQDNFLNNRIQKFRAGFRSLDLLIIDDLQLIGSDSEQTHRQFLGLFNFMSERSLPIVLTSDCPVQRLSRRLPGSLLSRIAMGVDVTVSTPDLETRCGILHSQACALLDRKLPDEVARYLATQVRGNCRDLIGALKRLALRAEYMHAALSVELGRHMLTELNASGMPIKVSDVIEQTARHYTLQPADLCSKRRIRTLVTPRHVAMFLCRELTQVSLPSIGEAFHCHHSSVLHACRKIAKALSANPELSFEVTKIRQELAS